MKENETNDVIKDEDSSNNRKDVGGEEGKVHQRGSSDDEQIRRGRIEKKQRDRKSNDETDDLP